MKMIKTDKLVFEYAKRDEEGNIIGMSRAVDEVDLDIEPGQFIAILGHNGSGKSTLAKHMNAILVPTEGTMWVDGKDTKEEEYLWDIRQSAGMVFQNPDRYSGGRRCRIWPGESRSADGTDLEESGGKPEGGRDDRVSASLSQ